MKRIYFILFTIFLNMALSSCTHGSVAEEEADLVACCGNEGDIPPPPPPPPPGGDH